MKDIKEFINESSFEKTVFGNMKSTSVFSSLILYACNHFKDFMNELNPLETVENKDLTEDVVKKILQSFDDSISDELGADCDELSFK